MLRDLRLALALLTVLPLAPKGVGEEDFKRSVAFFPLAGYLLGLPLALLALLPLPPGLSAALGVALLLGLTGFLHLDGLLDLADALLGARPREERLRILKDPHLGAFAFGVGGSTSSSSSRPWPWCKTPSSSSSSRGGPASPSSPSSTATPSWARGWPPWSGGALALCPPSRPALPPPLPPSRPPRPPRRLGVARLAWARLGGLNGDALGAMIALGEVVLLLAQALLGPAPSSRAGPGLP